MYAGLNLGVEKIIGIEKVGMSSKIEEVVPDFVTGRFGVPVSYRGCKFLVVNDMELW